MIMLCIARISQSESLDVYVNIYDAVNDAALRISLTINWFVVVYIGFVNIIKAK